MPTLALSLFGFMDEAAAINYLKTSTAQPNQSDPILKAAWNAAGTKLGQPTPAAGLPDVQPLPAEHQAYAEAIKNIPLFASVFANDWAGSEFALVEIDPLLAYQFHVDADRSSHHCNQLGQNPSVGELLPICLPHAPATEAFETYQNDQSMILKTRSLNLRQFGAGMFNAAFMGIQFGVSLPFAHVVRFNGRMYLYNGFHRALGVRKAGATHMPCIVRTVNTPEQAGIRMGTFSLALLESANPPTLAHFTGGRSTDVMLRKLTRLLHVSWSDYVIPDDD